MGDRTDASITIYALTALAPHKMGPGWQPRDEHKAVLDLLREYGFTEVWTRDDTPDIETETTVRFDAVYRGDELSIGVEDEIGAEFDKLGVTYEAHGGAFYPYEATVRYGAPHLGVFQSSAAQESGLPVVTTTQIERLIEECSSHQELIDRLSLATGKAWRDFFDRANLPPTDDDMRLARLSLLRAEEALTDA
jgi:hypothetical protein